MKIKCETDGDIVYRCKDCEKYGLCEYYHGRKETSQICHYFELPKRKTGTWLRVHPLQDNDGSAYLCSCCRTGCWEVDPATWKACPWCTALMEEEEEDDEDE